jgi:hypothetical protein
MASVVVYDGARGNAGNKIFVEEKGKGVFLDYGKTISTYLCRYRPIQEWLFSHAPSRKRTARAE